MVRLGTATEAQVEGIAVAGKTGTARKVANGSYASDAYRASFVGFFPADDPQVVLAVVLDAPRTSPYGGRVSAPVFQRTAARWISTFPRLAERVSASGELPSKALFRVPDVEDLPVEFAVRRLTASGLRPRPSSQGRGNGQSPWDGRRQGNGILIAAQEPEAGGVVQALHPVRLDVSGGSGPVLGAMPDFTGWTMREATYWLIRQGIRPRIEGDGVVEDQHPAEGQPLDEIVVLRSHEASPSDMAMNHR